MEKSQISKKCRILFLILLFFAYPFLCACGKKEGYHYYYKEKEITEFVLEHEEELRQQIAEAGEDERIEAFDGIRDVSDRREGPGIVYYEYSIFGILTSSLQAGFYYSETDEPSSYGGAAWVGNLGFGWSEVDTEIENLWKYEEDSGDNYCYTRKICDNFYYVVCGN